MSQVKSPYEQAIAWTIALRDSPDDPKLADAFLDWFEESDEHQAAWAHVEQTRYIAEEQADYRDDGQDAPLTIPLPRETSNQAGWVPPPQTSRRFSVWTAAPVALATIALLLYAMPAAFLALTADHMTGAGETKRVTLQDGSVITLGAKSAVAVGEGQRSIELLAGVAFFDVVSNSAKPFLVSSDGISVRVVGTAFEVRQTQRGATIAVAEGEVEIDNQSGSQAPGDGKASGIRLRSGTSVNMKSGSTNKPKLKSVVAAKVGSWKDGELSVNDWPIEDVVSALRRHYPGLLIIQPGQLRGGSVSGVYDLRRPLAALQLLAATRGLRVRQLPNLVAIISAI
ncbi:MAG: FecR domain-containing protein [Pseudomonadota bacterium]